MFDNIIKYDNNIQWDGLFYRYNTNILLKANQRRPC